MIYYVLVLVAGILIDVKDLKESNNKSDLIFYILLTILALGLGIYYYLDPTRQGISEYVIKMLNMEGV
ncbi:MAG: hypothetical protein IKK84_02790 [Clostridia bacterium]|nr:hypothetical protein [Clostridia bacterium]MBR6640862.1 hypothetical protein [Clostridia bacterium]